MEKNMRMAYLYDFYGDIFSEKQQHIFEMYYDDDCSLGEIAEQVGISRQGVRDCVKRCETLLFQMEQKLGLASRFEDMTEDIDNIKNLAVKVYDALKKRGESDDIMRLTQQIIRITDILKNKF